MWEFSAMLGASRPSQLQAHRYGLAKDMFVFPAAHGSRWNVVLAAARTQ